MNNIRAFNTGVFFIALVGTLIIASPVIQTLLPSLPQEEYTELFLLGSNHEADNYPFKISQNERYGIYVDIVNHREELSYYKLLVKIRGIEESAPDAIEGMPSSVSAFIEYNVLLTQESTWEKAISFSFPQIQQNDELLYLPEVRFNEEIIKINKTITWTPEKGYYSGLLFELYLYNEDSNSFQFDNRFNEIWLNMSAPQ